MDELAKQFADLAEKYGPTVINAAKGAARMEGYSTLAGAGFSILLAVGLGFMGWRFWRWAPLDPDHDDINPFHIFAALIFIIAAVIGCIAIWPVIDPWTWAMINNPELWLAKRALKI